MFRLLIQADIFEPNGDVMPTSELISKIDITLQIPPLMRGIFPNKERLSIKLEAGIPKEVPDYVARYYVKNRPKVYRIVNRNLPVKMEVEKEPEPVDTPPVIFDAPKWLEFNYMNIEDAIPQLERDEKFMVAKALRLNLPQRTGDKRLEERIIQDVKVKNKQQEEIAKHKGAEE